MTRDELLDDGSVIPTPAAIVRSCTAPVHDTRYAYDKHRCRCPKALALERDRKAKYRATLPRGSHAYRNHTDIDPVAVDYAIRGERLANGQRPQLGREERRLAVERLHRARVPGPEIARRLGITTRSVDRHLSALRTRGTRTLTSAHQEAAARLQAAHRDQEARTA